MQAFRDILHQGSDAIRLLYATHSRIQIQLVQALIYHGLFLTAGWDDASTATNDSMRYTIPTGRARLIQWTWRGIANLPWINCCGRAVQCQLGEQPAKRITAWDHHMKSVLVYVFMHTGRGNLQRRKFKCSVIVHKGTRSRRWKSWEMQQIQTGTKDAENSWFCKQQDGFMQTTFAWLQVARNTGNAMWHQRCSKLTMLPSSVRTSATQYRIFMLASDSAKKV